MKANSRNLVLISGTVTGLALVAALFSYPWPYSGYTVLRYVVSLNLAFTAWAVYRKTHGTWGDSLAVLALIFNPLVPLHLTREIWVVIDSITISLIAACLYAVCFRIEAARPAAKIIGSQRSARSS